jgi:ribonuclease HI
MPELKTVEIYTDGACKGNPGPGGFGVLLKYGKYRKKISGGVRWTTNNRMELRALVEALAALKEPVHARIHTDSQYLIGGLGKGWIKKWKRNNWQTREKTNVQNRDLWERLDGLMQVHTTEFRWVKGHADDADNNLCDHLAVNARKGKEKLGVDEGYERTNPYQNQPARH